MNETERGLSYCGGVTGGAESAVDEGAKRQGRENVKDFAEHDGNMIVILIIVEINDVKFFFGASSLLLLLTPHYHCLHRFLPFFALLLLVAVAAMTSDGGDTPLNGFGGDKERRSGVDGKLTAKSRERD